MSLQKRPDGAEQPSTLGGLKFRIPLVHYKLEIPDILQGMILCVVPLGITALMTQTLGIPFEVAVAFVLINNFLYLLHTHFGDPAVSGWITAGIPLYIAFLTAYPEGEPRILALIALQLTVAALFLAESAGNARAAFCRAHDRCGVECPEYPLGCQYHEVHAQPWSRQGAVY